MTIAVPQPETIKARKPKAIYYPTQDGKPLAEGDKHLDLMFDFVIAFKAHFANLPGQPDVYVSGNNFVFYQEGDPMVEGRMRSEHLTLDLIQQDDMLNLFDPLRDVFLPMPFQALERTRKATQARAKAEKQRKELEAQRANEEAQRAESESQARAELEAENERLRAQLAALLGANQT